LGTGLTLASLTRRAAAVEIKTTRVTPEHR
jgi:hypothetical protein